MSEEMTTGVAAPTSVDELEVGMELKGTIKRIELYGAFVDIGVKTDGLLHISQLGKPNVRNVEDVVKAGETVTVYVLKIEKDAAKTRIALSLTKPPAKTWDDLKVGDTITGTVTKVEKFGVFVNIGAERDAMIHVSELAAGYVNSPADVAKVGDQITAQIIKVDPKKRRIDLSKKALEAPPKIERAAMESAPDEKMPTAMELAFQRADTTDGRKVTNKWERRSHDKGRRDRDLEEAFDRTLRSNK